MNTAWHASLPPHRSDAATMLRLVRERFYSFVTVLGTGFLLLVSLVLKLDGGHENNSVAAATWIMSAHCCAVSGPLYSCSRR